MVCGGSGWTLVAITTLSLFSYYWYNFTPPSAQVAAKFAQLWQPQPLSFISAVQMRVDTKRLKRTINGFGWSGRGGFQTQNAVSLQLDPSSEEDPDERKLLQELSGLVQEHQTQLRRARPADGAGAAGASGVADSF